jgi:hypothetical protein
VCPETAQLSDISATGALVRSDALLPEGHECPLILKAFDAPGVPEAGRYFDQLFRLSAIDPLTMMSESQGGKLPRWAEGIAAY